MKDIRLSEILIDNFRRSRKYIVRENWSTRVVCEGTADECCAEVGICKSSFYAMARGVRKGKQYDVEVRG